MPLPHEQIRSSADLTSRADNLHMCILAATVGAMCRTGSSSAVDEQQDNILHMAEDLAGLKQSHERLLESLPEDSSAPVPPEARSQFDGLRLSHRQWESRMSSLLAAVASLQSPSKRSSSRSGDR